MNDQSGCYCHEITFPPCPYCNLKNGDLFESLSKRDKAILIFYKMQLQKSEQPTNDIIKNVNEIFTRYPDLSVFDIP